MGERADAPKEEATALSPSDMAHNNNNNIVSPPLRQPYFLYPCPARGQPVHCTFELGSCLAHEKVESNEEGRIIDLTICSPSRRIVDTYFVHEMHVSFPQVKSMHDLGRVEKDGYSRALTA